ncbi:MBL fold metallo-hydrolase [Allofournierella sp. CML151]|uniref:MBL fold metallo-hydrolase n=1 Tax=Allofournierella sp. CML151 TaxID=2998082 RepID=UPI0022EB88F6|nr:MBL fold metallo-hydrolase [Fournierella sp. CML151]
MEKKLFYAPVEHPRCGDDLEHPWKYAVPAYKAAPHVWQVGGQDDVCAYLLDSGEGLILIDTGYRASFYLLIDRIWRAGYDPKQIKKILLSHWHWDHVNGARYLQELTGAEVWISKADEEQHQLWKDRTDPLPMVDYRADHFYDDSTTIDLGRFSIHTRLTPGHTPGATSFWFDDTDETTGETFRCAMHGGIGVGLMAKSYLEENGLSLELPHIFIKDCLEMADSWKVDICLPSHLNQGNVKPNIPEDKTDYRVWIDGELWGDVLRDRAEAVKKMYPEVYSAG